MYDKFPSIHAGPPKECTQGWPAIGARLGQFLETCPPGPGPQVVCVECYPGASTEEICSSLARDLHPVFVLTTESLLLKSDQIDAMLADDLTDDPVFGRMNGLSISDFFSPEKLADAQNRIKQFAQGTVLIVGVGASLIAPQPSVLVYADMARWELQLRQRANLIGNLGAHNLDERAALKYKRAFFVDWRAADRLKRELLCRVGFLLDTNTAESPRMISGDAFRSALAVAVRQPFRVVPFFDPGPWGGHWMERVCDLPDDGAPNHAWCFDCVPEENSVLLAYGDARVEIPSIDVVFAHPRELLGEDIYARFGAEFPIRFDFLDTMGGGNLSLQVHPLTKYIREHFAMDYTQDESYYMLDAEPGAGVYLGLKENIDRDAMIRELEAAQAGGEDFPAEKYVNRFPAKRHDHFLIPAGTIHCSGRDSMVLEISATPYIFTFKLWDWGRAGLDGRPRPVHLQHGIGNIQWDRDTAWVSRSLVNRFEPLTSGEGWREERTGLHELEFIETRRHWFTGKVPHSTQGTVHVLNLVEGAEAIVESPTGAFKPFIVHYAETWIVPAVIGEYSVRPHGPSIGHECATLLAYVRPTRT